jgi:hypothetical protein
MVNRCLRRTGFNSPAARATTRTGLMVSCRGCADTKMIVSIMQPYLFPYIGYFQLISASDVFVIYDDAQYMKGGWVNRNRILLNGAPHWLTIPVEHAPVRTSINGRTYRLAQAETTRLAGLLESAYRRAPGFARVSALFKEALAHDDANVARFNAHALKAVCGELGVTTQFVSSSALGRDVTLGGRQAVIDICRILGASGYLNPVGGAHLYQAEPFARHGLELAFVRPADAPYAQPTPRHVPRLSVLDVLMWSEPRELDGLMRAFEVIAADELETVGAA